MANDRVQAKIDLLKGKDETGEVKSSLSSFGSSIARIGEIAAGVGLARFGEQILEVGKNAASAAVSTGMQFEQWKMGFDTMLGSGEKASKLLSEISEFAKSTPFELTDLVSSSRQLVAYGFAQEEVIKTTKTLGDISAGVGAPINELVYLFGTLRAQNVAYTKDLNQFTARGIPVLDLLAEKFGVTKDKVMDMASKSKIGFKDIEQVFQKMTSSGGIYFDMMSKQSKTISGVLSNIKDNLTQVGLSMLGFDMNIGSKAFGQVKEGSIFDRLQKGATSFLSFLDANQGNIIGFFNGLVQAGEGFWAVLQKLGTHIKTAFNPVLEHLGQIYAAHKEAVDKIATALGVVAYGAIVAVIYIAAVLIDKLASMVDYLFTVFGPAWTTISDMITQVGASWDNIVNGMKQTFENLVNGVVNGINKMIEAFNNISGMNVGKLGTVDFGVKSNVNLKPVNYTPVSTPALNYTPVSSNTPAVGANMSRNISIVNNNTFNTSYDPTAFARNQAWQISGR